MFPPVASSSRKTPTLIPISVLVTTPAPPVVESPRIPLDIRATPCGLPECSGQRWPTGAGVMHSVQIGRPHSEHEMYVSRSGCR